MKAKEIKDLWVKIWADMLIGVEPDDEEMKALTEFAEISFKAGQKAEREKILNFIDQLDNGTRSSASWRSEVRKFRQALKGGGLTNESKSNAEMATTSRGDTQGEIPRR
ncbi:unnamed protein product [marine sediment metagenome]|uniref:Uncharacterized protein n=1 Tax=marine sediment metagenome TaxID=412755 RepID=X1RZT2_9ZZZZ